MQKYLNSLSILIMAIYLTSCGILSPVARTPVKEYQIDVNTSNVNSCSINPKAPSLQIFPVQGFAPYDTRKMYYSESQYQLNNYTLSQWSTEPNIMLTQVIQQKLLNSCIYSNVVSQQVLSTAQYRLVAQILDFHQIIRGNQAQMRIDIVVQLINNTDNMVIKSKEFIETTTVTPNVEGYITGANTGIQQFVNDLSDYLQ